MGSSLSSSSSSPPQPRSPRSPVSSLYHQHAYRVTILNHVHIKMRRTFATQAAHTTFSSRRFLCGLWKPKAKAKSRAALLWRPKQAKPGAALIWGSKQAPCSTEAAEASSVGSLPRPGQLHPRLQPTGGTGGLHGDYWQR